MAALQAIATIAALLVGALWTYALTSQFRETVPKLAIKQDVASWKLSDGSTLVRVDSTLTNTSKVRIAGIKGRMIVWRLLPETKEQAENYAAGKIWFDCRGTKGELLPDCIPEQGLNVPASGKRTFDISDPSGLEPGESVPYWRYMRFDGAVRTIEVYTFISKPGSRAGDWVFDSTYDLKH